MTALALALARAALLQCHGCESGLALVRWQLLEAGGCKAAAPGSGEQRVVDVGCEDPDRGREVAGELELSDDRERVGLLAREAQPRAPHPRSRRTGARVLASAGSTSRRRNAKHAPVAVKARERNLRQAREHRPLVGILLEASAVGGQVGEPQTA